jgi:hypothetical protein
LFVSDVALLRQTFALVLERWPGLRTVQVASLDGERGLLADLDGDIALAVVSVDTADGPDTGLIEHLHGLGLPVLAFGLEGSTDHLASALEAGAAERSRRAHAEALAGAYFSTALLSLPCAGRRRGWSQ